MEDAVTSMPGGTWRHRRASAKGGSFTIAIRSSRSSLKSADVLQVPPLPGEAYAVFFPTALVCAIAAHQNIQHAAPRRHGIVLSHVFDHALLHCDFVGNVFSSPRLTCANSPSISVSGFQCRATSCGLPAFAAVAGLPASGLGSTTAGKLPISDTFGPRQFDCFVAELPRVDRSWNSTHACLRFSILRNVGFHFSSRRQCVDAGMPRRSRRSSPCAGKVIYGSTNLVHR